jgi:hypothetical protein
LAYVNIAGYQRGTADHAVIEKQLGWARVIVLEVAGREFLL